MKKPASNAAQRKLILEYLHLNHRLSTIESREILGVMSPAPRVFELRQQGWNIVTHREWRTDSTGTRHFQGVYTLLSGGEYAG